MQCITVTQIAHHFSDQAIPKIQSNYTANAWKISLVTQVGEFGWDDAAKQAIAASVGSGTDIDCTAIMMDCTLANK